MPLYEMIILSRAGSAQNTGKLIKHVSRLIDNKGGVLRTANILGDRIMSRTYKGNDRKNYIVGNPFDLHIIKMSEKSFLVLEYILKWTLSLSKTMSKSSTDEN